MVCENNNEKKERPAVVQTEQSQNKQTNNNL